MKNTNSNKATAATVEGLKIALYLVYYFFTVSGNSIHWHMAQIHLQNSVFAIKLCQQ